MEKNTSHWAEVTSRYSIEELIGMGSHGHVVRAVNRETGRQVAIKYIWNVFSGNYPAKKAIREIAILRHMRDMEGSKFVCHLHEVIAPPNFDTPENNYLFMVLDYMPCDLKTLLDNVREIDFPEEAMVKITYNLLCCLNFLHSANVLHRDLKPANILINESLDVKLCDFGLSRTDPSPLPD